MTKILAAICLLLFLNPCQAFGEDSLPEGPGKEIVLKKCQACHDLDLISAQRGSKDKWTGIMEAMVDNGLVISEKEKSQVLEYLSSHLGPGKKK